MVQPGLAAGREVGLEQVAGGNPGLQLAHLLGEGGRVGVPAPVFQGQLGGRRGRACWRCGRDQCCKFLQPLRIASLQPQQLVAVLKHHPGVGLHGRQQGQRRRAPVGRWLHPGSGLVAEPTQPGLAAGRQFRQHGKGIAGTGLARQPPALTLLDRCHRQQAALALGRAIAVEPHQPCRAQSAGQGHHHLLRRPPGQLYALGCWLRAHRQAVLARSGRPASTRAASRMRQLSHTPQGCSPPL